jgi:hypothetical protein
MKTAFVSAVLALVLAAGPAAAQAPPEPLPMGVPYMYQPGNPNWYRVLVPQPSYYPFGSLTPVFGRYSWDYVGSAYPVGMGWYQSPLAAAPYWSYGYPAWSTYPTPVGRVWYGFGW